MNFISLLQIYGAAPSTHCASIRYPASALSSPPQSTATSQQLGRCAQFQFLTLNAAPSFQNLFRGIFRSPIEIPWRLDPAHLQQFALALNSYRRANSPASQQQILQFIFEFPLREEGWHLQLDQVSSREASPERTAIQALRDHHAKCTGIAYVYAALLTAAGYNPQFAWRSQNISGEVIEHLYLSVQFSSGERYVFDPLFYGVALHHATFSEAITTISPREVLAWHYNNEAIDLVNQSRRGEALQLFRIALDLDPLNPHIRRNLEQQ
ncbi:MAG: hypothetical protein HQM15_10325 [Deltaproteobacteria bacterium]|nr:hypothetical protein [Deltaproteobacteria bacterium]